MGQVNVSIGGRSYKLLCGDGEEAHLTALAGHLEGKARELTEAIGAMSEPRLLLMAGLQVADELFAARRGDAPATAAADDARYDARYDALLARAEALAAAIDRGA